MSFTDGISSRVKSKIDNKKKIQRLRNSNKASKILGFKWLETSKIFPDNQLDTVPLLELIKEIERYKKKINPEIIITHHNGDLNIDHKIINSSVITAFRPKSKSNVKKIISFEINSSTEYNREKSKFFFPNLYVDIKPYIKKKIIAFRSYKEENLSYPNSRSLEGLKNLAKYRGNQIGVEFAEAYEILLERY